MIEYKFKDCLELQLIDTNCNNCVFMLRDLEKYKKWETWHRDSALQEFNHKKVKAVLEAQRVINEAKDDLALKSGKGMLFVANKMNFHFDKKGLLNYGYCTQLKKDVSFIPLQCMPEHQNCFIHRKELTEKL